MLHMGQTLRGPARNVSFSIPVSVRRVDGCGLGGTASAQRTGTLNFAAVYRFAAFKKPHEKDRPWAAVGIEGRESMGSRKEGR